MYVLRMSWSHIHGDFICYSHWNRHSNGKLCQSKNYRFCVSLVNRPESFEYKLKIAIKWLSWFEEIKTQTHWKFICQVDNGVVLCVSIVADYSAQLSMNGTNKTQMRNYFLFIHAIWNLLNTQITFNLHPITNQH